MEVTLREDMNNKKPILSINTSSKTTANLINEVFNSKEIKGLDWFTIEYNYANNSVRVWDCYESDELCLEFREDVDALTVLNHRGLIKPTIEYFTKGDYEYNG